MADPALATAEEDPYDIPASCAASDVEVSRVLKYPL